MGYDFYALDVETANEQYWSICQIGIAHFVDGDVIDTWESYVDPETSFDSFNIAIHGITPELVSGAMHLPEMVETLRPLITEKVVAHHMPFDRLAFSRLAQYKSIPEIPCLWVDTAKASRRLWKEFRQRGYSLKNIAQTFGIEQEKPHDALDDAITAGKILVKAINDAGSIEAVMKLKKPSITESGGELKSIADAEADPSGIFYGEVIVFTGALTISRLEAARAAYGLGFNVDLDVTKETTMLVVGTQDLKRLAGQEKSSKQRKAELLIAKGQHIRIVSELDFLEMTGYE